MEHQVSRAVRLTALIYAAACVWTFGFVVGLVASPTDERAVIRPQERAEGKEGQSTPPAASALRWDQNGLTNGGEKTGPASWYDYTFRDDGTTRVCNRRREWCWTQERMVAAARDWPRGTRLLVRPTNDGAISWGDAQVVVTVTDYGPDPAVHPDRVIDLSSAAFAEIAPLEQGIIHVTVTPVAE